MPLKYVSLGQARFVECNEHSSFFQGPAGSDWRSSVYSLRGPCGWDLLSGCVLWHHVQPRNVQRRLQAQDPGSEVYLSMVLSVAGTGKFHCCCCCC